MARQAAERRERKPTASLVLQHAADEIERPVARSSRSAMARDDRGGAMRIVPAVEPDFGALRRASHQRPVRQPLQPRRPFHGAQALSRSPRPRPSPLRPRMAQRRRWRRRHSRSGGGRSVWAAADRAGPSRPDRPCGHVPGGRRNPGRRRRPARSACRRGAGSRRAAISSCGPTTTGTPRLDDAGLLGRDGGDVVAQKFADDRGRPAG